LGDDAGAAFVGVAGEAAHHRGVDDAGADGVDADAVGGVVQGGRFGEADEAVLGCGVGGLALEALDAGAGRGVDDRAAAAGQHERDLVLHGDEHATEVDRHQAVPLRRRDRVGRLDRLLDARVVEGDIQAAEALDGRVERRPQLVVVGHVAGHRQRLAAGLLDQPRRLAVAVLRNIGHGDRRTLGGERQGGGAADAARRAGDEGDPAVEPSRHPRYSVVLSMTNR
jgi:hypothetical protein